ncbi:MAG: hypothetical protein ACK5VB_02515 [Bacteroidota bacterium]|nr:DUF4261 domain-containing protein [Saprospiraceae bacterium]
MRSITLLLLLLSASYLASFAQSGQSPRVITGTVLLSGSVLPGVGELSRTMTQDWKLRIDSSSTSDKTIILNSGRITIMIAQLDYPVDHIEIRAASRLAWRWPDAETQALKHTSQAVISVVGDGVSGADMHIAFSRAAAAILASTTSAGVYMNAQYLLVSGESYLSATRNMTDNQILPLYCWIYFGRPGDGGAFTFGMEEFGCAELEISGSQQQESDVQGTLYDAVYSVLKYGGRQGVDSVIITEEGQKIPYKTAKSSFIEGVDVWRLDY